jgi:transcriptional regulator with XRE-family HTH domain
MTTEDFGAYVRRLRESRPERTTQAALARAVGVSRAYINQIESGGESAPLPGDDVLRKLSGALGVPPGEMFDRAGRAPAGFALVTRAALDEIPTGADVDELLRAAGVIEEAGFSRLTEQGKRIALKVFSAAIRELDEGGEPDKGRGQGDDPPD